MNTEWIEPLQSVCKWAFHADASGKTVIQELAMDADSSIVFVFTPTKIADRQYMGSYTDKWGLPIYLRTDESGGHDNCASRVIITRDENGYDGLIAFVDDNGNPQKNDDGAYMTQQLFDEKGNQTLGASLDLLGNRMIDDWGNCGWIATYQNGFKVETQNFDENGNPIRMPKLKEGSENVYGYRYYPDKFGRDTTIAVIDADGNPDVGSDGIHKICRKYNDHGQVIYEAYYDLNGHLCNDLESGCAKVFMQYDRKGRKVLTEFKDKYDNYVTVNYDYCKEELAYKNDSEYTMIRKIDYIPDESDKKKLVKSFEYIQDEKGNAISTSFSDNYKKVESVDSLQRPILAEWYDLDNNPSDYWADYHKHITTYDDNNGVKTEQWFDAEGKPSYNEYSRNYSTLVTINDGIKHTIRELQFKGDTLIRAYEKVTDPKTGQIIQQYDLTPYGEQARVGWGDNLYYHYRVHYGLNGKQKTTIGLNEFDEPSYSRTIGTDEQVFYIQVEPSNENEDTGSYYITHNPYEYNKHYYDENCNEISSYGMEYFIAELPRAYCIEITDTAAAAYNLGMRNGDIIVSYGDWRASKDLNANMNDFYLETILKVHSPKSITLLRHHPSEKSSEIVKLLLPAGKVSDLGFYPHKIYYTQKEKERFIQTCINSGEPLTAPFIEGGASILLAVQKKGSMSTTPFYYDSEKPNKDAGIVLYDKSDRNIWSIRKNAREDVLSEAAPADETHGTDVAIAEAAKAIEEAALVAEAVVDTVVDVYEPENDTYFSQRQIFLTHDMNDLCELNDGYYTNYTNGGLEIIPVTVSKSFLERIQEFYAINSGSIPSDLDRNDYLAMNDPAITTDKMIGKWHMNAKLTEIVTADLTLKLNKNNQATFSLQLSWLEGNMELSCLYHSTPKWSLNGVCLEFDFDEVNATSEITKIEGKGLSEEEMTAFKEIAENIRERLESYFSLYSVFDEDYFVVKELTKKEMKVLDGQKERVFTKVK